MPASRAIRATITAVDFGPIGGARSLGELLPTGPPWRTVTLDPLTLSWRSSQQQPFPAQAAAGAASLIRGGTEGGLMIAQCSAAGYAVQVHRHLCDAGTAPALLVLVEPVVVTRDLVLAHVAEQIGKLGADAVEVDGAVGAVAGVLGEGRLTEVLDELMRQTAVRHAPELGLDPAEARIFADQLVVRYVNWIGFLAAQLGARPDAPSGPVRVLAAEPDRAVDRWCTLLPGADRSAWTPVPVTTPQAARDHLATLLAGESGSAAGPAAGAGG